MRTIIIAALAALLASSATATASHLITGKDIKNGSVTGVDLKNRSVGTADLRNGSVKSSDIGADAVRNSEIADGAVDTSSLDSGTVSELEAVEARTLAERSAPIQPATTTVVRVDCPAGLVALGGGARIDRGESSYSDEAPSLVASQPVTDSAGVPRAWEARVRSTATTSPNRGTAVAFATCAP